MNTTINTSINTIGQLPDHISIYLYSTICIYSYTTFHIHIVHNYHVVLDMHQF